MTYQKILPYIIFLLVLICGIQSYVPRASAMAQAIFPKTNLQQAPQNTRPNISGNTNSSTDTWPDQTTTTNQTEETQTTNLDIPDAFSGQTSESSTTQTEIPTRMIGGILGTIAILIIFLFWYIRRKMAQGV